MSQLYMKEDCDFLIREGKLQTTEENNFEDIKLRILHRIQSNMFDWIFNKNDFAFIPSANLSQFLGNQINSETINLMKKNIFDALTYDELINPSKIYIKELPIDKEEVVFYVSLIAEKRNYEFNLGMAIMYNTRQNITTARIEKVGEEIWD